MKLPITIVCLLIVLNSFSQNGFSETDAKQIIDTFFEGFHKGDTLLMSSVLVKDTSSKTAYTDQKGNKIIRDGDIQNLLEGVANRPADQKWQERILDYSVHIDGNLAQVWTPYEFWFNDTFSHCGANSFTLVSTDDGWKIIGIIDSRRKEDCRN